jgi:hypothetical protein
MRSTYVELEFVDKGSDAAVALHRHVNPVMGMEQCVKPRAEIVASQYLEINLKLN